MERIDWEISVPLLIVLAAARSGVFAAFIVKTAAIKLGGNLSTPGGDLKQSHEKRRTSWP